MADKGKIEGIQEEALKILGDNPKGLEYGQLHKKIDALPAGYNPNTIAFAILALPKKFPDKVVKVARTDGKSGSIYRLVGKETEDLPEKEFYELFAEHLVRELVECTAAITVGGNRFGSQWRTPDVLGTYNVLENLLHPPIEIVSAEIKTNPSADSVATGFGQACAYKAFSHKAYLVIPKDSKDLPRIEFLCMLFGIGLVLFNRKDAKNPQWEIKARATKTEPDYSQADDILRKLDQQDQIKLIGRI